ncbi:hypothetical protein E2C01_067549 [Portunus trituberculatus]|uniref:Uncharacterized protein n=1 Tax=Portunus trituberculatus TaxID=210409 RepID=A0A5B7HVC6_PORTR|nr:hypothetical protein [Portunus trituberculatus]
MLLLGKKSLRKNSEVLRRINVTLYSRGRRHSTGLPATPPPPPPAHSTAARDDTHLTWPGSDGGLTSSNRHRNHL